MLISPAENLGGRPSFVLIEAGITLLGIGLAFCCPRAGSRWYSAAERTVGRLARRRGLSVLAVGIAACALRLAILPTSPIPEPFIHDEFSYLLAADTFASGRLTNPTHPLWTHFESFHISHQPSYMSMYFPAQGLMLAVGKILFGHPWFGVWISSGLMCAAICWMLQGWVPLGWALLGGALAIMRLGLFSYWANSYEGSAVAAIGGALVLGALPRIMRKARTRDGLLLALGTAILANSRPYEGVVLCLPVMVALLWWVAREVPPPARILLRRAVPAAVLLLLVAVGMGYYNHRVVGSALTLPQQVNRATYAVAPYFVWGTPRPEPPYRHQVMREFYVGFELPFFNEARTIPGFLERSGLKLLTVVFFFFGPALMVPLVVLPRVVRDQRVRFLVLAGATFAVGLGVNVWFAPHYAAPFTAGLYGILLQAMRHLRAWRPEGQPAGRFLVRAMPVMCLALIAIRLYAVPLKLVGPWPTITMWYGSEGLGVARATTLAKLESYPGHQLAIVRYSSTHDFMNEWVYNAADIDTSKVVWAREMDTRSNAELLRYFRDRTAWLVEPDYNPPKVSPYPMALTWVVPVPPR
jgi:hypothetical protein